MDWESLPKWGEVREGLSGTPRVRALQERYSVRWGTGDGALVLYCPHPKQAVAHALPQANVLYGGAFAGGKSRWLRWHLFISAMAIPRFKGLLMRRDLVDLERSHLIAIEEEVPKLMATHRKALDRLVFPNGSLVQFGHCNTEKTFRKWLSSEWDMIALDEATTFTEDMLIKLQGRLRTKQPQLVRPQYVLASNPGGPGHAWLKSRFIDKELPPGEEEGYRAGEYVFLQAMVVDNPYIDPEHAIRLEAYPPDLRRAYLDGDWDVFMGQYFTGLLPKIHGFDFPDGMPEGWRSWPKYRSFDWGYSSPSSMGWWVIDPDGNVWRYRELYLKHTQIQHFMARAREFDDYDAPSDLGPGENPYEYTVCDPSCFDASEGKSKAEQANEAGVPMIPAERRGNKGVRVEGWSLMRHYIDPSTTPMLRVARGCKDWWRTVPALAHDETHVEDVNTESEDHCADETRYFLMSRPVPPVFDVRDPAKDNPFTPGTPEWYNEEGLSILGEKELEGPVPPSDPVFGEVY